MGCSSCRRRPLRAGPDTCPRTGRHHRRAPDREQVQLRGRCGIDTGPRVVEGEAHAVDESLVVSKHMQLGWRVLAECRRHGDLHDRASLEPCRPAWSTRGGDVQLVSRLLVGWGRRRRRCLNPGRRRTGRHEKPRRCGRSRAVDPESARRAVEVEQCGRCAEMVCKDPKHAETGKP